MKVFWGSILLWLLALPAKPQGCSSAGFCTMGALKSDQKFSERKVLKLNYVELSHLLATSGLGEQIQASTLDISVGIGRRQALQMRLPYVQVQGPLARTEGLGDVYLTYNYELLQKRNYKVALSLGTKLPRFSTQLSTAEGLPLPMYYSPSLGTYDVIAGISWLSKRWLLGLGYQQALPGQSLDNAFDPAAWAGSDLSAYDYSVGLRRGADVMLRVEHHIRSKRFNFFVGVLPVYRVSPDEVQDTQSNTWQAAEGSTGLALTGLVGGGYRLNVHSSIKLLYGQRLLQRDYNGDGLMKAQLASIAYEWRF